MPDQSKPVGRSCAHITRDLRVTAAGPIPVGQGVEQCTSYNGGEYRSRYEIKALAPGACDSVVDKAEGKLSISFDDVL